MYLLFDHNNFCRKLINERCVATTVSRIIETEQHQKNINNKGEKKTFCTAAFNRISFFCSRCWWFCFEWYFHRPTHSKDIQLLYTYKSHNFWVFSDFFSDAPCNYRIVDEQQSWSNERKSLKKSASNRKRARKKFLHFTRIFIRSSRYSSKIYNLFASHTQQNILFTFMAFLFPQFKKITRKGSENKVEKLSSLYWKSNQIEI